MNNSNNTEAKSIELNFETVKETKEEQIKKIEDKIQAVLNNLWAVL